MFKPYSLKITRVKTNVTSVKRADSLEEVNSFMEKILSQIKSDSRSQGETFELVIKKHNDAAFNYDILTHKLLTY